MKSTNHARCNYARLFLLLCFAALSPGIRSQVKPAPRKDYVLITVVPQKLEVVNVKRGIIGGDSITWAPPAVTFSSR